MDACVLGPHERSSRLEPLRRKSHSLLEILHKVADILDMASRMRSILDGLSISEGLSLVFLQEGDRPS